MFIKRYLLPIAMLIGYVALTVDWLNATLTPDEAATYLYYAQSPLVALFGYTLPNNHLANSLLIWMTTSVIGGSELAIRLPSYFIGLLAVMAVYRLAYRLGGWSAAISAVVILTTTTTFAHYVLQARGNTLAVLLTTLLVDAMVYQRGGNQRGFGYGIMAMAAGSVLALPTNILLNAAVGLWALRFRPRIIAPLIVGTALGSMFYGSLLLYRGMATAMAQRFGSTSITAFLNDLYGTFSLVPFALIGVGAALIIGLLGVRHQRRLIWLIALILIVPLILAPIQFAATGRFFYGRNYLYLAGVIAPLAGLGFKTVFRQYMPLIIAMWLIVVLPLPMSHPLHDSFTEDVLTLLDDHVAPEGAVLLVGCCYDHQLYYYRNDAALYDIQSATRIYVVPTPLEPLDDLLTHFAITADCTRIDPAVPEAYLCQLTDQQR